METTEFVYVSYINTTADKLWQALTTPEFTRQYWGGRALESTWEVGSPVRSVRPDGGLDFEGVVVEADRPKVLTYTWKSAVGPVETRATFRIEQLPTDVRLTVTHAGLPAGSKHAQGVSQGWPAILSSLKTLLETGVALDHSWWRG